MVLWFGIGHRTYAKCEAVIVHFMNGYGSYEREKRQKMIEVRSKKAMKKNLCNLCIIFSVKSV